MIERLLICTSFSDGLYRFTHCIPELAAAGLKHIVFFHAVPLVKEREIPQVDEARVQAARDRLKAELADCPADVTVEVVVTSGKPVNGIKEAVETYGSEMIMVGTAHRTLLDEKLFGSTTTKLSRALSIPLLILRPQLISVYTTEELALRARHLLRCFLIPFDDSSTCQGLMTSLERSLGQYPECSLSEVILCWVTDKPTTRELIPSAKPDLKLIEAARDRLAALGLKVSIELRQGNPLEEIEAVAIAEDISAIAIASERFGKFWEWSMPSMAGELIRQCWHPVLFIPGKS